MRGLPFYWSWGPTYPEMTHSLTQRPSGSRSGLRKAWTWQALNCSLPRRTLKSRVGVSDLPNELVLFILEEAAVSAQGTLQAKLRVNRALRSMTLHTSSRVQWI